ncbi:hypothetical protein M0805_000167 [Coniferiporia weirii]|nr:hypothetical protein M0805_000167 [Coniferiporia weirii]
MVFVNDKKYACETCIKGHRSSTCNHRDRPLFEIKKKGRPITQCEHCRELRKTKQVHVKCLCEGREDIDTVSHSIPAKKANRKGPAPSAAFPHGLQSASDTEDVSPTQSHPQAVQRTGEPSSSSPSCACKSGAECECCTVRHVPRPKRSLTPPRPKIGDIRTAVSRCPSETGDVLEVPAPHSLPHELSHGHGVRSTHGAALYNPYGLAHDAHMRNHDMRGHEVSPPPLPPIITTSQQRDYTYPPLPLPYERQQQQRQAFGIQSEVSPTWPSGEGFPDDVDNLLASLNAQEPLDQLDSSETDFGSVDVDAWLRQLTVSNPNSGNVDVSISSANSSHVPQILPVPQALDISGALTQDQDFSSVAGQYDMYSGLASQLMGFDVDSGNQYLSGGESDHGGDVGDVDSVAGMFDPGLLSFTTPAISEPGAPPQPELLHAPTPYTAYPMFAFNAQLPSPSGDANTEAGVDGGAFDFLTAMAEVTALTQGVPGLPALSRSSSTGSHASSRSRSSLGGAATGSGRPDIWRSAYDAAGFRGAGAGPWSASPFPVLAATPAVERGQPWLRVADAHVHTHDHAHAPTRPHVSVSAALPDSKGDTFASLFN